MICHLSSLLRATIWRFKVFSFYGKNEHSLQQNAFLYSDDTINDILENIKLVNNSKIVIDNPMVKAALISW